VCISPTVPDYLRGLASLAPECADRPELLCDLLRILMLVPATLAAGIAA
jgi:hypothetical protein